MNLLNNRKALINTRALILLFFCLALPFSFASAGWSKKPEFRWKQFYRWDRHFDKNGCYSNRFSLSFAYLDGKDQPLFKVMPFFEMLRNYDTNLWERRELGVEIGKDILTWLYLGESIQHSWKHENLRDPDLYVKENTTEAKTIVAFSRKFFRKNAFSLKGFIIDEYTYDTDEGSGMRNEIIIGASLPLGKHWEAGLNWRHIDRIHYFDTDTFEAFATLIF